MRPQCPGGSTAHFPKRMGEVPVYIESSRETTYHKCHKTESCKYCSKHSNRKKKTLRYIYSFLDEQYDKCSDLPLRKQDERNKIAHFNKHCKDMKELLGVMSEKLNNSYHTPGTISRTAD